MVRSTRKFRCCRRRETHNVNLCPAPQLRHATIRLQRRAQPPYALKVLFDLKPEQAQVVIILVVATGLVFLARRFEISRARIKLISCLYEKLHCPFHPPQCVKQLDGSFQNIMGLLHKMNGLGWDVVVTQRRLRLRRRGRRGAPPRDVVFKCGKPLQGARETVGPARGSASKFGGYLTGRARQVIHAALEF